MRQASLRAMRGANAASASGFLSPLPQPLNSCTMAAPASAASSGSTYGARTTRLFEYASTTQLREELAFIAPVREAAAWEQTRAASLGSMRAARATSPCAIGSKAAGVVLAKVRVRMVAAWE